MRDQIDDEVERALAKVNDEVRPMSADAFAAGRAKVLAGISTGEAVVVSLPPARQARSRGRRWLPVAIGLTAASIMIAGVLVAQRGTQPASDPGSVTGCPAPKHPKLSGMQFTFPGGIELKDTFPDQPLEPGTYLYLCSHSKGLVESADGAVTTQSLREIWIPANRQDEWLERRTRVGSPQWWPGSRNTAEAERELRRGDQWGEWRAPCGSFDYLAQNQGVPPCQPRPQDWHQPTPEFLASLPRDPSALFQRLLKGPQAHGMTASVDEALLSASQLLETGLVPKELRSALYEALRRQPGITTSPITTLDRRTGLMLSGSPAAHGADYRSIILEPLTYKFLGSRTTVDRDRFVGEGSEKAPNDKMPTIKKDTVIQEQSFIVAVVDKIGTRPVADGPTR